MSPAKAAQARNYNAGVGRNWKRAPVERKRTQREELLATPAMGHGLSKDQFKDFRSLGYTGSSAFTWQEATDFANHSPVGKSLVCDALGGSHDECVLGGKLTGVLGLIYDVFLADIPECSTGQAEACAGVAATVVPGGGMGKLGKAAEEAAKAAKAGEAAANGRKLWKLTKDGAVAMKRGGPFGQRSIRAPLMPRGGLPTWRGMAVLPSRFTRRIVRGYNGSGMRMSSEITSRGSGRVPRVSSFRGRT